MTSPTYALYTHDAWGRVHIGDFGTLAEARAAFSALCQDPWYRQDGGVRGVELVACTAPERSERLDWHAFRS